MIGVVRYLVQVCIYFAESTKEFKQSSTILNTTNINK